MVTSKGPKYIGAADMAAVVVVPIVRFQITCLAKVGRVVRPQEVAIMTFPLPPFVKRRRRVKWVLVVPMNWAR